MNPHRDKGFTMVELLVTMALSTVLGTLVLGSSLSLRDNTSALHASSDLQDGVRLATERLVRELRQAGTIEAVQLPVKPSDPTSITFWSDFNGDGVPEEDAADPEVLTYRFLPGSGELTLTVDDPKGNVVTTPILATDVTAFTLDLRSSHWQYDRNGDGIVTWQELDATPGIGNNDGIPDGAELGLVDSVVITLTVADGPHHETYRTQVDFRNLQQS